jgi:hypothetical protein
MRRALLVIALAAGIPAAPAATKAERCEKYKEELVRIEKAKAKGGSEARLHKLEAQRQKVLAAQAKHHC